MGPTSTQISFIVVNGSEKRKVDLTSGPVQIGRLLAHLSPRELLGSLRFDSKVVSRTHAKVFLQDGKVYVQDTKSSSGTFLNGQRLSNMGEESEPQELRDGDILKLGEDYNLDGVIHRAIFLRAVISQAPGAAPQLRQPDIEKSDWGDEGALPMDGFGIAENARVQAGIESDFEQVWRNITQDLPRPLERLRQMTKLLSAAQVNGTPQARTMGAQADEEKEGSAEAGRKDRLSTLADDGTSASSRTSEGGQPASPKTTIHSPASPEPASVVVLPIPRIATPPSEAASGSIRLRVVRDRLRPTSPASSTSSSPDSSPQRPLFLRVPSGSSLPKTSPTSSSRVLASARAIEKALSEVDSTKSLVPALPVSRNSSAGALDELAVASYVRGLSTFSSPGVQARLVELAEQGDRSLMNFYMKFRKFPRVFVEVTTQYVQPKLVA